MFARTPRLLLRPGWPEDADALYNAINDEAIVRNLASAPWPYERRDAEAFLALPHKDRNPRWLIYRRTAGTPRLIGTCGLEPTAGNSVELGYWIGRDHWGLGYATEAGRAVLETAKALNHQEIVASHFIDNPASANVLTKLGFRPSGRILSRFSKGRNDLVKTVEFLLSLNAVSNSKENCDIEDNDMRRLAA
ncbi:GNAT family N-acetyltransferase [Parasphingorhabdus sp. JC815]|uniref:GNAT family N-acetyltransferase n=1 Tax=Parasphingorhabdus sp. JC815 TaxID=3232140 RepID=UPI003458C4DB